MHKIAAATVTAACLIAGTAAAAPPDQVYEFTVITDTAQTPAACNFPEDTICIGGVPPSFFEVPVPYKLATLTLTHDALTKHTAQASDMTNPITDDHRIVTLTFPTLPGSGGDEATFFLSIPTHDPFCPADYLDRLFETLSPGPGIPPVCSQELRQRIAPADGYTLDLTIVGDHLSGIIDITDFQTHGVGCSISMQGKDNRWSGEWLCIFQGGEAGSRHAFTATSARSVWHGL